MKINHVAIYTDCLDRLKSFYEIYLGGVSGELYYNKTTGFKSYFLSFEKGARLEIMTRPKLEKQTTALLRTGIVHIAFSVGSRENVNLLTTRLENDGYTVVGQPRTTGDGYYESCVLDPDGNIVEITE